MVIILVEQMIPCHSLAAEVTRIQIEKLAKDLVFSRLDCICYIIT